MEDDSRVFAAVAPAVDVVAAVLLYSIVDDGHLSRGGLREGQATVDLSDALDDRLQGVEDRVGVRGGVGGHSCGGGQLGKTLEHVVADRHHLRGDAQIAAQVADRHLGVPAVVSGHRAAAGGVTVGHDQDVALIAVGRRPDGIEVVVGLQKRGRDRPILRLNAARLPVSVVAVADVLRIVEHLIGKDLIGRQWQHVAGAAAVRCHFHAVRGAFGKVEEGKIDRRGILAAPAARLVGLRQGGERI